MINYLFVGRVSYAAYWRAAILEYLYFHVLRPHDYNAMINSTTTTTTTTSGIEDSPSIAPPSFQTKISVQVSGHGTEPRVVAILFDVNVVFLAHSRRYLHIRA